MAVSIKPSDALNHDPNESLDLYEGLDPRTKRRLEAHFTGRPIRIYQINNGEIVLAVVFGETTCKCDWLFLQRPCASILPSPLSGEHSQETL
jgi:hypothetical protein